MALTDWFVVENAKSGDGSRNKPFHDPWLAIRNAAPGDTIHIAAGTYYGQYDRSSWIIDSPRLTIRGGYSRDFITRTPWQTPSVFAFFKGYENVRENNMIGWRGEHAGLMLDGLFFDASGANIYDETLPYGIRSFPRMSGPIASFNADEVTIQNCVFANGGNGGVELSGSGSRFENNLVLNMIGPAMLDLRSAAKVIGKPILVKNNSFCFMHDVGDPPGAGGDTALGVRIHCPAVLQDNLFVSCGNAAISLFTDPERVSIERNLFFLTPRDVLVSRSQGNTGEITEKSLEELEDIPFKACVDNEVQNPGAGGCKTEWLDACTRNLLATYVKPPFEAANTLRATAGLVAVSAADLQKPESKGALAPHLAIADALSLSFTAKQGANQIELAAQLAQQPAASSLVYRSVEWAMMTAPDVAAANARVELRVGLGGEQNSMLLADAPPDTHMGVKIYQPATDDSPLMVLIPRYTLPARQYRDAMTYSRGLDVESTYLLRGVYRTDVAPTSRQKATLVVESLVLAPLAEVVPPRPEGRDWFVRAGSKGGDGSRDKPFRDPFQALDKAEGGDVIHVAGGDYFGKLNVGQWRIAIRNLTLLGGYTADFSARDPWENPTRFQLHADEKAKGGMPPGIILGSDDNSEGLIVDGFIFDGASWNSYKPDKGLDLRSSPLAPLVSFSGGRAPITVRNCVFVNGSSGAVKLACPFGLFENNVVLNTSGDAVTLSAGGLGPWTLRNNTILFACDPTDRAGTGKSSSQGTLLQLNGRAVVHVQSNILAFADNYGVRSSLPQPNVSFDNNALDANLFIHLTDTQYLWADASNWERRVLADSAFASVTGNTLELPELPVDKAFADNALARLRSLPSRIADDQWKAIAARIGASFTPAVPVAAIPPPPEKPAASAAGSLNSLMSRLGGLDAQRKQAEPPKTVSAGPPYCPALDWKAALALFQSTSETLPGAHRKQLEVRFTAPTSHVDIVYTPIAAQDLDTRRASLDNQPIEIDVTEARDSSANPSLYPAGTSKNDFTALSVVAVGGDTRTRLAIVVKFDTAAAKVLGRMKTSDKLRVRGIAHGQPDSYYLSVLVDSIAPIEG